MRESGDAGDEAMLTRSPQPKLGLEFGGLNGFESFSEEISYIFGRRDMLARDFPRFDVVRDFEVFDSQMFQLFI